MMIWEHRAADKQLEDFVRKELDKGEIKGYRRNLLETQFCIKGYSIARDSLFEIIKQLDPKGLKKYIADKNQ